MTPLRTKLLIASASGLLLAAAVVAPGFVRGRVTAAIAAVGGADPRFLAVAAVAFFLGFCFSALAWRAALNAAGGRLTRRQTAARLGVGCAVNSFAPAKLGDAVKVTLCSRALDHPSRLWTAGGAYAALAAARALALAALIVAASSAGALPIWPALALCAVSVAVVAAAAFSKRWSGYSRIASLRSAVLALAAAPRAGATVVACSLATQLTRLAGTTAVVIAFGLPHPLLAALVILAALDLTGVFPLTPGGLGIGSGAVAVALAARGIGLDAALGTGLAVQACETVVSLGVGAVGAFYLAWPSETARRWALRGVVLAGSGAAAAALGVLAVNLA